MHAFNKFMAFFSRPYFFLAATGVLLILASFLVPSGTVDIHVHDTYFVIDGATFFYAFAFLFLFWALIYLLTRKLLLSRYLTWTHILLSLLCVSVLLVGISIGTGRNKFVDLGLWVSVNRFRKIFFFSGALLIFTQLFYFVNLVGGLIRFIRVKR